MHPFSRSIQIELQKFRDSQARIEGVETYKVLQNQTIDLIARLRPETNLALLDIKGIGPAKAKKYGPTILRIVKETQEKSESPTVQHRVLDSSGSEGEGLFLFTGGDS